MVSQPQYTEDMRQFEQYQQCLTAKFTDIIKALGTADERARLEVQQLLSSKDATIQDLQAQLEKAKSSRETYEKFYHDSINEKDALEKELEKEQLVSQGLRSEMKEKEEQYNTIIADKNRLNDILTKSVDEKSRELEKLASYPEQINEKDKEIKRLSEQNRKQEEQAKEADYNHRMELLEKDRLIDQAKAETRQAMEAEMARLREKQEAELEKIREKYDQAQAKIQELMEKGSRVK